MDEQITTDDSNVKINKTSENLVVVNNDNCDSLSEEKDKSLSNKDSDASNDTNSEDEAVNFDDAASDTPEVVKKESLATTTTIAEPELSPKSLVPEPTLPVNKSRSKKKLVLSSEDEGPHDHFDKQEDLILKAFKETEPKDNEEDLEKLVEKYKVDQLPEKVEQLLRKKEFRIEKTGERLKIEKQEERERKRKEKEMEQKRKAWANTLKQKQKEEERKQKNAL